MLNGILEINSYTCKISSFSYEMVMEDHSHSHTLFKNESVLLLLEKARSQYELCF